MNATLDDRTFESGVPLTPEQQQDASAYFEAKGYDVTTEEDRDGTQPPAEETVVAEPPADGAAPADAKPAEGAAPAGDDSDLDPESRADWQSAKNDGERLGKYAKRTRKIHELTETVAERDRKLAELATELAETKGRLAERQASAPPAGSPLQPPTPAVEVKQPEPPKAREFSEPAPEPPNYNNFLEEDDPVAAMSAATVKHTQDFVNWTLKKRDFEASEVRRVEAESNQQTSRKQQMDQKFESAKQSHSDFDTVTRTADYSGMLNGILLEILEDGLELGYQLALPEHAEARKKINEYTKNIDPEKDPVGAQKAMQRAIQDLAVFRHTLTVKAPAATEQAAPTKEREAAAQPPAQAGVQQPPVTPQPAAQPRREEAAPIPVKGRSATPAVRLEDVPQDDYDARRKVRYPAGMVSA